MSHKRLREPTEVMECEAESTAPPKKKPCLNGATKPEQRRRGHYIKEFWGWVDKPELRHLVRDVEKMRFENISSLRINCINKWVALVQIVKGQDGRIMNEFLSLVQSKEHFRQGLKDAKNFLDFRLFWKFIQLKEVIPGKLAKVKQDMTEVATKVLEGQDTEKHGRILGRLKKRQESLEDRMKRGEDFVSSFNACYNRAWRYMQAYRALQSTPLGDILRVRQMQKDDGSTKKRPAPVSVE